jgi:ABC-type anion transport system duplicated permease subunit
LLGYITSLFSIFLAPWYALKNGLQKMVQKIAEKLGTLFSVFVLPLALLAFFGDVVTMILEFIVSLPRLLLSPFTLVRTFFSMFLQFFVRLVAKVIWA